MRQIGKKVTDVLTQTKFREGFPDSSETHKISFNGHTIWKYTE